LGSFLPIQNAGAQFEKGPGVWRKPEESHVGFEFTFGD
jgi:hypothetical protein